MSGAELAYSPDCPVFTGGLTAKGYYTDIYLFVNDGCVPSLAFFAVGGLNFCLNVAVAISTFIMFWHLFSRTKKVTAASRIVLFAFIASIMVVISCILFLMAPQAEIRLFIYGMAMFFTIATGVAKNLTWLRVVGSTALTSKRSRRGFTAKYKVLRWKSHVFLGIFFVGLQATWTFAPLYLAAGNVVGYNTSIAAGHIIVGFFALAMCLFSHYSTRMFMKCLEEVVNGPGSNKPDAIPKVLHKVKKTFWITSIALFTGFVAATGIGIWVLVSPGTLTPYAGLTSVTWSSLVIAGCVFTFSYVVARNPDDHKTINTSSEGDSSSTPSKLKTTVKSTSHELSSVNATITETATDEMDAYLEASRSFKEEV